MAHQGQIIAFAEFSCSQSEAIKHTRGLMGHTGAPTCIRAGPSAWLWNLPPTLMGLRTRVEGWKELCSGGLKKKTRKGPSWTPEHELGTCCAQRARKAVSCWGQPGRRHSLGRYRQPGSQPHSSLPRSVPRCLLQSPCLFPEETGASNQALGKQFFNLQLQTLIPLKLILQFSTSRPRLCPRIP